MINCATIFSPSSQAVAPIKKNGSLSPLETPVEWCSLPIFPSLVFSPSSGEPEGKGRFSESISWGTKRPGMRVILGEYCDFDLSASSSFRSFKNSFFSLAIGRFFSLFFFFFLSDVDIPAYNWKTPPPFPSPPPSDRSYPMITRQSKYHRARGSFVPPIRRAYVLRIRLRGNKSCVSVVFREEQLAREKSRQVSLVARTRWPLIYCLCESWLTQRVWPISTLNFHKLGPVSLAHT